MKCICSECIHRKYAVCVVRDTGNLKQPLDYETVYFSKKRFAKNYIETQLNYFKCIFITLYKRDSTFDILGKRFVIFLFSEGDL